MSSPPPVALTIAGSDCSAGAGLQADLKTFQHFHVHGLTVVTCVVSETANLVQSIHAVPPEIVADQLALLLEAFPVAAIKTGMLCSASHIEAILGVLNHHPGIPLVIDPVMIASTGDSLLEPDAMAILRDKLLPLATLVTPNLPEAEALSGVMIRNSDDLERVAILLRDRFGPAFLVKGGHLDGPDCLDFLAGNDGLHRFTHPRIPLPGSHGTGCTLSAAITANLALGLSLKKSVASAKDYLTQTLEESYTFSTPNSQVHALNQGTTL